jgi:hypothetical protein
MESVRLVVAFPDALRGNTASGPRGASNDANAASKDTAIWRITAVNEDAGSTPDHILERRTSHATINAIIAP